MEIFEDDDIVVYAPDFIQEMGTLLKQTPKRYGQHFTALSDISFAELIS